MKSAARILSLGIGVVLLVACGTAVATVSTPVVRVRLVDDSVRFTADKAQTLALELMAIEPISVSGLELTGKGWQITAVESATLVGKHSLQAGETLPLNYRLTTSDENEELSLTYWVNDRKIVRQFDVSAAALSGNKHVQHVVQLPDMPRYLSTEPVSGTIKPLPPQKKRTHAPLAARRNDGPPSQGNQAVGDKSIQSYNIRVTGQLFYREPGGRLKPAHGTSARVYDEDWTTDELLGSSVTGPDGRFDFSVHWSTSNPLDTHPDLYMSFVSGNDKLLVQKDYNGFYLPYVWNSVTLDDFSGTAHDFGNMTADGSDAPALGIVKAISRAAIFLNQDFQYSGIPSVDVYWPAEDWPHYERPSWYNGDGEIFIPLDFTGEDHTYIHEYGHHWVNHYGGTTDEGYCTYGYCDHSTSIWHGEFDDGCGHCAWCPEHLNSAYQEGIPDWISDAVIRDWRMRYPDGVERNSYEQLGRCQETGQLEYAYNVEGNIAALLEDLEDGTNEDSGGYPPFADVTTLDPQSILLVADHYNPTSAWGFIQAYKTEYPAAAGELWETASFNGFVNLDTTPPTTLPLYSNSHDVGVASPDNSVDLGWFRAMDDFSQVGGYGFAFTENAPVSPDSVLSFTAQMTTYTKTRLAPGTYYATLRACDRAGNWDSDYVTYGPIVIREPDPGDLRPETLNANWAYPLVPKDTQVASEHDVPADTYALYGNTYWNACVVNYGEDWVHNMSSAVLVDGYQVGAFGGDLYGYGTPAFRTNQGPINVDGGRHTFELSADEAELYPEPDETDNRFGHQWIWLPEPLVAGGVQYHDSPPMRTGGWSSVTTQTRWYNCTGYSIPTLAGSVSSPWAILAVRALSKYENVNIRLHDNPTGADTGYTTNLGYSTRPKGNMDAVIVNAANRPAINYVAGVMNAEDFPAGQYSTQLLYGQELTLGQEFIETLAADEGVDLFTFDVASAGPLSVYLHHTAHYDDRPLYAAWYDASFVTGDLLDYQEVSYTDEQGDLRLDINPGVGLNGLVLWRDPGLGTLGADSLFVTIKATPPDLTYYQTPAWDLPLIVASGAYVTTEYGPTPSGLWGESAATYYNFGVQNIGQVAAPASYASIYVDGVNTNEVLLDALAPGAATTQILPTPATVRGGRHVVAAVADYRRQVPELDEQNNSWGTQYVWRPGTVGFDAVQQRPEPPFRTADWDRVTSQATLWFNCDGIKTPSFLPVGSFSHWGAVAVLPGNDSDVDIRLHEPHTGVDTGFDVPLVSSGWGKGESDFVLMNLRNTPMRDFEAGLIKGEAYKVQDYQITVKRSLGGGTNPNGEIGTYPLESGDFLALHEFNFTNAAYYTATLTVSDPTVDLGFTLYGPDLVFGNKQDIYAADSAAWLEPAGASEQFSFTVTDSSLGYYCLAVWKVGSADGPVDTDYTLSVLMDGLVSVPGSDLPAVTGLGKIYPNPFNPQTTIQYDQVAAGPVAVTIYNLAGSLVRSLVHEQSAAGRHEVVWNGRDNGGRRLASGTYMVQLVTGGVRETRKLMLVK